MDDKLSDIYYKRHLPHYNPREYPLFITFRLANSLPLCAVRKLKQKKEDILKYVTSLSDPKKKKEEYADMQREYFLDFDQTLDKCRNYRWLMNPNIAEIVKDAIHYRDGKDYQLISYVIMPNHVHMLFIPLNLVNNNKEQVYKTTQIMKSLKRYTAKECNKVLNRLGPFWQQESYDHVVRNEKELKRIIKYIANNPIKAGLIEKSGDWEWYYLNYEKLL